MTTIMILFRHSTQMTDLRFLPLIPLRMWRKRNYTTITWCASSCRGYAKCECGAFVISMVSCVSGRSLLHPRSCFKRHYILTILVNVMELRENMRYSFSRETERHVRLCHSCNINCNLHNFSQKIGKSQ